MSKHNILTEDEFEKYVPNKKIITHLENYVKRMKLKRGEVNVLDWGCGRGRYVLYLREKGYNAFGVDIDPEPIKNGMNLFKRKGYNNKLLSLIDHRGKTGFTNNFFHFIFSTQVFEHISNIEPVAAEFQRISAKGGIGYHVYPAHRRFVEGHLQMPFVHWLPKNRLRKYMILLYVLTGCEPKWKGVNNNSAIEKTDVYFRYSITKTFYRKHSNVKKVFENYGFNVSFETIDHPKLKDYKLFYRIANFKSLRPIVDHLFLTFKRVELFITKP